MGRGWVAGGSHRGDRRQTTDDRQTPRRRGRSPPSNAPRDEISRGDPPPLRPNTSHLREFVNYRHPGPRRVWKGGSEPQSPPLIMPGMPGNGGEFLEAFSLLRSFYRHPKNESSCGCRTEVPPFPAYPQFARKVNLSVGFKYFAKVETSPRTQESRNLIKHVKYLHF